MCDKQSNILLSICIPTYNRAEILDKAIESYVNDKAFDDRVEIVISDNCSTDNTKEIVVKYQKKYKNIIYHCNENNILDKNFSKALSLGRGKYLKLMNDTVLLNPCVLESILKNIEKYRNEKPVLLFYKNNELHANKTISCSNLNQFIAATSYYITWTANFGAWKDHFDKINDKERFSFLQFLQVDWSLKMINSNNTGVIIYDDWFDAQNQNIKGGYNIFEVFLDNYLFIYTHYLNTGKLSYVVFRKEKTRLLKNFISNWTYTLLFIKDVRFNFDTKGYKKIMSRHYKFYPILYFLIVKLFIKYFLFLIKRKI